MLKRKKKKKEVKKQQQDLFVFLRHEIVARLFLSMRDRVGRCTVKADPYLDSPRPKHRLESLSVLPVTNPRSTTSMHFQETETDILHYVEGVCVGWG